MDFANHQQFTLRCLSKGLVPVSIHLQKNIKTPKGLQILRTAERGLMNERVRSINNTLNIVRDLRNTCIDQLREVLNDWMDKCREFIEVGREEQHLKTREFIEVGREEQHLKTLNRQKEKFKRLSDRE